jgi:formyl-CoA transferase
MGHAVWFSIHGRNKLCVSLDLKIGGGEGEGARLCARADALIENFRRATWNASGLGPEALHASTRA